MSLLWLANLVAFLAQGAALPSVVVRADDTVIAQSCRIEIPPGTVLEDRNQDGVLQVRVSDIVIEFADGTLLRGAGPGVSPDQYEGYGIRIQGARNVTIRGGRVSGFRAAVWATATDGLTLENLDASDGRRSRLKSDPLVEDEDDWLYPHSNDANEWLTHYGAALYVEDSANIAVRRCRVHHGQNALCLDRVSDSKIYDNDFSFNSGWGLALWRCNRNVISRNAADFCIRGYSHNIYNRGQDSAGILLFEQNNDNVLAENSATHGGDGFFGYAGHEAIRGSPSASAPPGEFPAGNNRNLLIQNDFSYAAAHGIEMTFSFGNRFLANRLVGNAICGIWGGFSQDTLIAGNEIANNGAMGYGLERGGINIDSSRQNRILHNRFSGNRCAVHLWWGEGQRAYGRWAEANLPDWEGNVIAGNEFAGEELVFHFRGPGQVCLGPNVGRDAQRADEIDPRTTVLRDDCDRASRPQSPSGSEGHAFDLPPYPAFGDTHPVGARSHLRGRENIIMTEWGPWDHASPLVRRIENAGRKHVYGIHHVTERPAIELRGEGVTGELIALAKPGDSAPTYRYTVSADSDGVHPYTLRIRAGAFNKELRDALLAAIWDVTRFRPTHDPVADPDTWRAEAGAANAERCQVESLYTFELPPDALTASQPTTNPVLEGHAQTGTLARTQVPIPAGRWELRVVSDDGVRVTVDGRTLIDAWKPQRRPRRQAATVEIGATREIEILVEHFRLRGYGALALEIVPAE